MNTAVLGYPFGFPDRSLPKSGGDWHFGAAVLASSLIHGFALGWLPGLDDRMVEQEPRPPLHVRFTAPEPEPAKLAVPPAPTFAPAAIQPVRRAPEPSPQRALPVLASPAADAGQEARLILGTEPLAATVTPVTAPRSSPILAVPVASRPTTVDAEVLAAYGRELAGAVATQQRYPRIALLRQWQGTAVLQLELAVDGRLLGVRLLSSSGHETLDRQALEMVREAVPLPSLPAALAGRPLTVDVPVVFRIKRS